MKEQIKKIHLKYMERWEHLVETLPDCSARLTREQQLLDDQMYTQITALCEAECQKRIDTMFNPDYLDFKKGVEAGKEIGQTRVKELIEKLELRMEMKYWDSWYFTNDHCPRHIISSDVWQAIKKEYLKKQEGVDV